MCRVVRFAYPPLVGTNDNASRLEARAVRPRACIVDDHAAVRQWLTKKLESLGVEVCGVAETHEEGLAALIAERPDIAVVDNRLPDGRGIDLCREISAHKRKGDPDPAHRHDEARWRRARPTRPA